MDPISIQCPRCQAKLRLRNPAALGKHVLCPKCKSPFVAKAPSQAPSASPSVLAQLAEEDDGVPSLAPAPSQPPGRAAPASRTAGRASSPDEARRPAGAPRSPRPPGQRRSSPKRRAKGLDWRLPVFLGGGLVLAAGIVVLMLTVLGTSGPRAAARAFMEASKKGDVEAIKSLLTEKARQALGPGLEQAGNARLNAPFAQVDASMMPQIQYTVGSATLAGDTAEVPVTTSMEGMPGSPTGGMQGTAVLRLRREAGKWRVYGMTVSAGPQLAQLTLDFENPAAIAQEMQKALEGAVAKTPPGQSTNPYGPSAVGTPGLLPGQANPRGASPFAAPSPTASAPVSPASVTPAAMPPLPHRPLDLAYLPADAEVIVSLRLGDLWTAPLVQRLVQLGGPAGTQSLQQFEQELEFGLSDVESVVFAAPRLADLAAEIQHAPGLPGMGGFPGVGLPIANPQGQAGAVAPQVQAGPGATSPSQPGAKGDSAASIPGLLVVHTRKPYDQQKLLAAIGEHGQPAQHQGVTYHRLTFDKYAAAVYFPNGNTIVFGGEDEVKEAMTRVGGAPPLRAELQPFNASYHLVLAIVPSAETLKQAASGSLFPGVPAAAPAKADDAAAKALEENVSGFGLSLHVTDAITGQALLLCENADAAKPVLVAVEEQLKNAREAFAGMKGSAPALLNQILEPALAGVNAKQENAAVAVTGAVPGSLFEPQTLASLSFLAMSMGMSGDGGGGFAAAQGLPSGEQSQQAGDLEPEAVLRQFLIAMMESDAEKGRALIVPHPDADLLWQGEKPPPGAAAAMQKLFETMTFTRLKVGDTVKLPGGRVLILDESHVNSDRMQISAPNNPIPFILVRHEGKWKVEPGPIIAARKAAAKAREQSKGRRQ